MCVCKWIYFFWFIPRTTTTAGNTFRWEFLQLRNNLNFNRSAKLQQLSQLFLLLIFCLHLHKYLFLIFYILSYSSVIYALSMDVFFPIVYINCASRIRPRGAHQEWETKQDKRLFLGGMVDMKVRNREYEKFLSLVGCRQRTADIQTFPNEEGVLMR